MPQPFVAAGRVFVYVKYLIIERINNEKSRINRVQGVVPEHVP